MIMDSVFQIIDNKINAIETAGKRASVIVINERLFKQMQQEMFAKDMSQVHGVIRSPFSLQTYRGLKVVASQVIDSAEVL